MSDTVTGWEIKRNGVTRIVFLIGKYAFKIPNFTCQHNHFLQGCYANWSEYCYSKMMKDMPDCYKKISPTVFCTWFGLISVQKRVIELKRNLTEHEVGFFKEQTTDVKKENFGYLKGKLVCIDYA